MRIHPSPLLCGLLVLSSCESSGSSGERVEEIKHPSTRPPPPTARPAGPPAPAHPMERLVHSKGQTLYVPVYSSLPRLPDKPGEDLRVILSIRNTDSHASLTVQKIDYYDTEGHPLEPVIAEPTALRPLESHQFLVSKADRRGGAGANFLVTWSAAESITEPIVEAIHVYDVGNRAFSFVGRARVIEGPVVEGEPQ